MIKKITVYLAVLLVSVTILSSLQGAKVDAQPAPSANQSTSTDCGNPPLLFGFPAWYRGICEGSTIVSPSKVQGGLPGFIWTIVLNILDIMLRLVGYISLGFVIFGGFKYIISGDNASGTAAAKKTILNAVIGLVLSIMAAGIVNAVIASVSGRLA